MERDQKKVKLNIFADSRKNDARRLFKKCFQNFLFSLVPFEIWRDLIASNVDLKVVTFLSQICWGFKELVDDLGEKNINLALRFRKEGQIPLARKYIYSCANNNNVLAMFHLGQAHFLSGWGVETLNFKAAATWFKKSAELGFGPGMVYYSWCLSCSFGVDKDEELSMYWAKQAMSSNDLLAIGCCYNYGLGASIDYKKAFSCFEASANQGDEFGQEFLGSAFAFGHGVKSNRERSFYWRLKAAEQGLCFSQSFVASYYQFGNYGREQDEEKAISWYKKSARQGNANSKGALEKMGIFYY